MSVILRVYYLPGVAAFAKPAIITPVVLRCAQTRHGSRLIPGRARTAQLRVAYAKVLARRYIASPPLPRNAELCRRRYYR